MTKRFNIGSAIVMSTILFTCNAHADVTAASEADKTFVSKVFEGDLYEVEASELAEQKAWAPNVKDIAYTEIHDHEQVNHKLKSITAKDGVPISNKLNATFSARLAKLNSIPTEQFDTAYLIDMEDIHKGDEKLFAKEAIDGSSSFQEFAHDTDLIVKRHIGALHDLD
jgi:putative membrane protein